MTRHAGLASAALLFVLFVAPVAAQETSGPRAAGGADTPPRERFAVNLFTEACVRHAGRPEEVAAWAGEARLPELPAESARGFLADRPGTVWSANNPLGRFVIAQREGGPCTLFARKADTGAARAYLEAVLDRIVPVDWTVNREVTERETERGILLSTTMDATAPDGTRTLRVTVSTSDSDDGNFQLALSAVIGRLP